MFVITNCKQSWSFRCLKHHLIYFEILSERNSTMKCYAIHCCKVTVTLMKPAWCCYSKPLKVLAFKRICCQLRAIVTRCSTCCFFLHSRNAPRSLRAYAIPPPPPPPSVQEVFFVLLFRLRSPPSPREGRLLGVFSPLLSPVWDVCRDPWLIYIFKSNFWLKSEVACEFG